MHEIKSRWEMFGFGAVGGVVPTIATLAATYVAAPDSPWPASGVYLGLALYAMVGGVASMAIASSQLKQAICAGIAAPAIIANMISAAADAGTKRRVEFIASAYAQIAPPVIKPDSFGPTLYLSPRVTNGGSNIREGIPLTATVKRAGKIETIKIGAITQLDTPTAFILPADVEQVFVMGQPVPLTGPVTERYVSVVTKPTNLGDFFWALGGPRRFAIEDVKVLPAGSQPPR